ncbi:MAG: hypothetical protein M3146_04575 [Thermoproteota archaeon]|nr:hypothetical protein [Thermoproteota archaeon]
MISGDQTKQILYKTIEEIGKEIIQADISSNIDSSKRYIDTILSQCLRRLTSELDDDVSDIITVTLCEALLHFMLTISTLPSERKVAVRDGLTLDIVIPSLAVLKGDPGRSVIIQFIKDKRPDLNKVKELEILQPNTENIWLVSSRPLSIPKCIDYSIFPGHGSHRYSNIIVNTDKFLRDVKDKSFRFIP